MAKNKKDKRTNNVLQNISQKTKDRATRTPLKKTYYLCYLLYVVLLRYNIHGTASK